MLGKAENFRSFRNQELKLRTPCEVIFILLLSMEGEGRRERGFEARQKLNEATTE